MISAHRRHPRQVRPGRGRGPQAGAGVGGVRARRGGADLQRLRVGRRLVRAPRPLRRLPARRPACPCRGCCGRSSSPTARWSLTSATLKLGGDFNGVGASLGLAPEGTRGRGRAAVEGPRRRLALRLPQAGHPVRRQAPRAPGRDGDRADMLDELTELIQAAGGRTLGLFSSMRGAQARRRGTARPAPGVPDPAPGRGDPRRADQELLGGPEDLPVRHAVALAGRRRARRRAASWSSWTRSRSRARTTR